MITLESHGTLERPREEQAVRPGEDVGTASVARRPDRGARLVGVARRFDEGWPPSLRTALSICRESRLPILIWWGPEFVMLYNDAYAPLIREQASEPSRPARRLLLLERRGFPEECYFTFSYSPIRDESGAIAGVFTAVAETTSHVIEGRRLRILRELMPSTGEARTPLDALRPAGRSCGPDPGTRAR